MSLKDFDIAVVKKLIADQFPQFKSLEVVPTEIKGYNNYTFRLGDDFIIRLPSDQKYVPSMEKEQEILSELSGYLSLKIPNPVFKGTLSERFPRVWSIYKWIDGKSVNLFPIKGLNLKSLAQDLALFLNQLHNIDVSHFTSLEKGSFSRGCHLSVYNNEIDESLVRLSKEVDVDKVRSVWQQAISSKWSQAPVLVHGDIAPGNLIINDKKLSAVIDWGGITSGDPACDLMIAWTFFDKDSRAIFKNDLNLDDNTWARGRGWALWKCLQEGGPESKNRTRILAEIFADYNL